MAEIETMPKIPEFGNKTKGPKIGIEKMSKFDEKTRGRLMIALLALLSAFPPLSTDMYLPAIPFLQKQWGVSLVKMNLTLICFFVTYCFFLLIYGPVSDRFGRRGPLMAGIGVFILASVGCALSVGVDYLIACRVLQAAGAAASSTLALAISKDVFEGHMREKVLAYVAVIMAVAPMTAPIFGGWIITAWSWRCVFVAQALLGAVSLAGVYLMPESIREKVKTSPLQMAASYARLAANSRYASLVLGVSILGFPFFAFIAGSADIYINGFGLSEQVFGYFFGFNAAGLMLGAMAFSRLRSVFSSNALVTAGFSGIFIGGLWMYLGGRETPWDLALPNFFMALSFGLSRPPSNNLILEQVDREAGAASSLLVFAYFMVGAVAMWIISLDWADKIGVLGFLGIYAGGATLCLWILIKGRLRGGAAGSRAGQGG